MQQHSRTVTNCAALTVYQGRLVATGRNRRVQDRKETDWNRCEGRARFPRSGCVTTTRSWFKMSCHRHKANERRPL